MVAWSLSASAAALYTSLEKGELPISPAGTVPRNTIQSQSQEALFFRDTLFPSLLPSVVWNSNLLLPCIIRIHFLLGTESIILSKRRADRVKIPLILFTEKFSHQLILLSYFASGPKEVKGSRNTRSKEPAGAFPFICDLSELWSKPERMRKERQKWNLIPVHLQDTLLSLPHFTDVHEGKGGKKCNICSLKISVFRLLSRIPNELKINPMY